MKCSNAVVWCVVSLALPLFTLAGCGGGEQPVRDGGTSFVADGGRSREVAVSTAASGTLRSAVWIAVQDGDGPWTAIAPSGGLHHFTPSADRYGVATVCTTPDRANTRLAIRYALSSEAPVVGLSHLACGDRLLRAAPRHTLTGTFTGRRTGEWATAALGVESGGSRTSDGFSIRAPLGIYDLAAQAGTFTDWNGAARTVFVRRGFAVSADATVSVDLGSGVAPATAPVTVVGGEAATVVQSQFLSAAGTMLPLSSAQGVGTRTQAFVPASLRVEGDLHELRAMSNPLDRNMRMAWSYVVGDSAATLTLPAVVASSVFSRGPTGAPYPRPLVELTRVAGQQVYLVIYNSSSAAPTASSRSLLIAATAGWMGTSATLSVPDLSSASGWDPAWALHPSEPISAHGSSYASNGTTAEILDSLTELRTRAGLEVTATTSAATLGAP